MSGPNIRAALRVARKDIKIFLKERGTLVCLLMPAPPRAKLCTE